MPRQPNGMLYHYCSTETFLSIVRHRSIWMSSLNLTNDSTEGKVMLWSILSYAASKGAYNGSDNWLKQALRLIDAGETFGFCLSEESDLLSQWRGYADDGRGICIGFRTGYLVEKSNASLHEGGGANSFRLAPILYNEDEQQQEGRGPYELIQPLCRDALYFPQQETEEGKRMREVALQRLKQAVQTIVPRLFLHKNPAFAEEREWRLLANPTVGWENRTGYGFRPARDRIIPYKILEIEADADRPIIKITLGPKHATPDSVIKALLEHCGFHGVTVCRSTASYR